MIYLDNAATTRVLPEVAEEMQRFLVEEYANPSSVHRFGHRIEKAVTGVREDVAKSLGTSSEEIFFTSCGTEANNIAILGQPRGQGKALVFPMEHSSVLEPYRRSGFDVQWMKMDRYGHVDEDWLLEQAGDAVMISLMHVNNEIGTLHDVVNISKALKKAHPHLFIHVDGIQGFMKFSISLSQSGIDCYTFSGHKIHAAKGIGGMYLRKGKFLEPRCYGGGQERGMSPGTENVAGILGLGKAVAYYEAHGDAIRSHCQALKDAMTEALMQIPGVVIQSPEDGSPWILNVGIPGTKGEVLVHFLENDEIYISTGSACHRNTKNVQLERLGSSADLQEGTLRISFSEENRMEEIPHVAERLKEYVNEMRKVMGYKG